MLEEDMSNRVTILARRRWVKTSVLGAGAAIAVLAFAACGSGNGDSSKTKTPTASKGTVTKTVSPSKTGTSGAGTAPAGTSAAATAGAGGSAVAGGTTVAGTTPGTDAGTPVPGVTPGTDGTPLPGATSTGPGGGDPVSSDEATSAADAGPDLSGGDPGKPKQPVGNPPTPPAGASIDAKTIAAANPGVSDIQVIIDLDATQPGIQSTREIKVGDVIEVGVVIANVPAYDSSGSGGLTALNFDMLYDRTRVIAPTYINGPSTDRNPDLNLGALGGPEAQWLCLPAPEGDRDDPGGPDGDGLPETGETFLSCYSPQLGHESGNIVVATVEFRAVKSGTIELALNQVAFYDVAIGEIASCPGDGLVHPVPCPKATLTIK